MIKVSAMYPYAAGAFDHAYYRRGICQWWNSGSALHACTTPWTRASQAVLRTLTNYTDTQPVLQISEVVVEPSEGWPRFGYRQASRSRMAYPATSRCFCRHSTTSKTTWRRGHRGERAMVRDRTSAFGASNSRDRRVDGATIAASAYLAAHGP